MALIEITISTDDGSITRPAVQVSEANIDRAIAYFNALEPDAANDATAFNAWVKGVGRKLKQDVLRYERDQAAAAIDVPDIEEV